MEKLRLYFCTMVVVAEALVNPSPGLDEEIGVVAARDRDELKQILGNNFRRLREVYMDMDMPDYVGLLSHAPVSYFRVAD